jgi:hypothetical protein
VHDFASFDPALRASGDLLGEIFGEIGDVIKMEVGSAEGTVCVFGHDLYCGAETQIERIILNNTIIHVPYLSFSTL